MIPNYEYPQGAAISARDYAMKEEAYRSQGSACNAVVTARGFIVERIANGYIVKKEDYTLGSIHDRSYAFATLGGVYDFISTEWKNAA